MALTALALPEKNDAAIYLAWGLAISVGWAPDPFEASIGVEARLVYLGLTASIAALFLYVANVDGIVVRSWLRRRTYGDRFDSMSEFFLEANVALQTWDSTPYGPPASTSENDFEKWITCYYQNAVQSYPVRQAAWSRRLQLVLFLSVWTVGIPILLGFDIPTKLALKLNLTPTCWVLFGLLLASIATASPRIMRFAYYKAARKRSGKDFIRDISFTAEIQYVHALLSIDSMTRPVQFQEGKEKHAMLVEVLYLQDTLMRGDWSAFVNRWSRFRDSVRTKAIERLRLSMTNLRSAGSKDIGLGGVLKSYRSGKNLTSRNRLLWMTYLCVRMNSLLQTTDRPNALSGDAEHLLDEALVECSKIYPEYKKPVQPRTQVLLCPNCRTSYQYILKDNQKEVPCQNCGKRFPV